MFENLAGKDVTLAIESGDITWKIKGADVPQALAFSQLDLGVKLDAKVIDQALIQEMFGAKETHQLSLNHDGAFGFPMTMEVGLGSKNAGLYANLYRLMPETNTLSYRGSGLIDGNGTASLGFTGASDYVVVLDEKSYGQSFTDVAADAYYAQAVRWAVEKGVTGGTTPTTFTPNGICTRAQAVTFLWSAMGSPEPTTTDCPFTDLSRDAYYYKAVLWATEKGITGGTSPTTFSPNATVTRAQAVTFLWSMAGSPMVDGANSFADVSADAYYVHAVLWAVEQGITSGTGAATFSPSLGCNRAQMVTFLYQYFGQPGKVPQTESK